MGCFLCAYGCGNGQQDGSWKLGNCYLPKYPVLAREGCSTGRDVRRAPGRHLVIGEPRRILPCPARLFTYFARPGLFRQCAGTAVEGVSEEGGCVHEGEGCGWKDSWTWDAFHGRSDAAAASNGEWISSSEIPDFHSSATVIANDGKASSNRK